MEKIEVIASNRGYVVTEDGKFINPKGEYIGSVDSNGYLRSMIRVKGKKTSISAHRLQAYQKYGNELYIENIEVRHRDGNPSNNSWDNILIGSHSENMMDIPEQIRIKKALHATSFVRKYNKKEVIDFYNISKSYKKTMNQFNISSKGTLHFILNKRKE